ncbi:MAG: HisA/HisF-related TIM barrel protein [Bacteroidia bacterium]
METQVKRIIPSIYTSDGQFSQTESRQYILDYNEAMSRAIALQDQGADELIIMDVTTIAEKRRNLGRFLKDLANNLNIPFTFGGGVHSVQDVTDILKMGVRKVYVNSAAVRDPSLINRITSEYGTESLMVAIDTKQTFGKWKVFLNGGKSRTEIDLLNWIEMSQVRGASEILVSTISRHSTEPADILEILKKVRENCHVPLLVSVGARTEDDFSQTLQYTGADGIVSGHFFLSPDHNIHQLKQALRADGILVSESRPPEEVISTVEMPDNEIEAEGNQDEDELSLMRETPSEKKSIFSSLLKRKDKEKTAPPPAEDEEELI